VVTSNVSSLPEVCGDGALLVDPHDPDQIADGIRRAVMDEPLRADLIAKGRERARQFSWARSVSKIHQIYMDVGGRA
jgi:glycosyltransferase involved in cell wall biosynthesis